MHRLTCEDKTQSLMDLRISVPLSCNSVSVSSVLVSLPVSVSVPVPVPVSISVSVSVPISISVPVSVSVSVSISVPAMVMVIAVVILCGVVITVGGPCWIRMSVLTVALVVLTVAVFPDMWLAVEAVMVVVVVIVVVIAVMMLVVISSLRPVSLHRFTHFSSPLLMRVPSAEPLARIPAGLRFLATGCLVVLAVMLRPAVVMMMVVVVVGVLRSLWFGSQELLCFFSLALFIPLILCWG